MLVKPFSSISVLCLGGLRAAEAVCYVPLCPVVPMFVPCQHGLVRRAGESITRMQQPS